MVYWILNRISWLDTLGRRQRSVKNPLLEDFFTNLQRLTIVHEKADKEGVFAAEIVPFTAYVNDGTGKRTTKIVTKDDGIRYGTTKEGLLKIRPAFPQWGRGQTTGGNASQITDGAAAVLLMTRRKAEQLGLKILAKHVTTSVCGLAPRIMGIGPSIAIPMVLEATGLTKDDVDLFEVRAIADLPQ